MTTNKSKTLKTKIDAFLKADGKINERLHKLLVETIIHTSQHKNCTMVAYLVNGLESSRRKGAIVAWIRKYTPVTLLKDADNKGKLKAKFAKLPKQWVEDTWKIEEATATPYWKKEDSELEQVLLGIEGLKGRLQGFIKRSDKLLEDETKVNTAEVIEMKAYLEQLRKVA